MSCAIWTPPPVGVNNTAILQAWITNFHNKMIEIGLVQAADTGQINPATIEAHTGGVSGQSYSFGFLLYSFDDDLQATHPVHVKFNFYSKGISPFKLPMVFCNLIAGNTNGAGLPGPGALASSALGISVSSGASSQFGGRNDTGVSHACFSRDRGFFGISFAPGNYGGYTYSPTPTVFNYAPICVMVSRSLNSAGEPTGDCVEMFTPYVNSNSTTSFNADLMFGGLASTPYQVTLSHSGFTAVNIYPFVDPDLPKSLGGTVQLIRAYTRYPAISPSYNVLAYPRTLMGRGQEFTALSGGVDPVNFVCLGTESGFRSVNQGPDALGWCAAMLFQEDAP